MIQLLSSDLELVVRSGFIYMPLLFDSSIDREIQRRAGMEGDLDNPSPGLPVGIIELGGRYFVRSVSIQSVLANYDRIDKDCYEQLKKDHLRRYAEMPVLGVISPGSKLHTILLKIMPYFIRKSRGLKRRQLNDEELLDLICSKVDIPPSFIEKAQAYLDSQSLLRRLDDLDEREQPLELLQDGAVTSEVLRQWFQRALRSQIVSRERARLEQELLDRELLSESKRNHIAALLYVAEKGAFELDGFGFFRIGSGDDYLIYRHTGEYTLTDYYARQYRFPDCRVAVSTTRPFRPLVLESYKHPFLQGHAPRQEICLRGYDWPEELSAENVIKLLEDGINALLYGYDARRRNGYHSLDRTWEYIKTIDFDDYRV